MSNLQTDARKSTGLKVGIGAALVAVPLGSVLVFMQLRDAEANKNLAQEQGAAYDVNAIGKIDPALVKYQQSATIDTGMKYARAIAIDRDGRLMIAGDRAIRILGDDGKLISELSLPDHPTCIAAGPGGVLLIGFRDHVAVYSANGQLQQSWPSLGPKSQITGIAATNDGAFVADAGRRLVVHCDLNGKIIAQLGSRDEHRGNQGLVLPSPHLNVITTADGKLLVTNPGRRHVETWTADGEVRELWGQAGVGISDFIGCCNPSHFAVMPDGRIITAEKGAGRVKVYHPGGKLDAVVAGPDVLGNGIHGFELAVDRSSRILVLEPGATEIRVFTLKDHAAAQQQLTQTEGDS